MDLTVQGGQSSASYMESAADWPPPTARVPRKPKVAQFRAAPVAQYYSGVDSGPINPISRPHGTTASISARNYSRRVTFFFIASRRPGRAGCFGIGGRSSSRHEDPTRSRQNAQVFQTFLK